ncbi:electron transfer flavoprotein alpha subunit apoprotein [Anaerobacterium chartisolvens]|uniref:Electron transfer flavoprotein alpha subunit apoprotein n=1 Tax=Anaerobacterium chartisolvens TaxID=1297424 RepID=A0A369B4T9_9FIRM|nr:electron transfer flavoprotein alpha subunit apoprotein [Anaerobacterium chartisolvens]
MNSIRILHDKCTKCGICIKKCLYNAIDLTDNKIEVNGNCNYCGSCREACRHGAISIERAGVLQANDITAFKGVWVFAEQKSGVLGSAVIELLGEGGRLAEALGVELSAVLVGHNVGPMVEALSAYGADRVYIVDNPRLENYNDELYSAVVCDIISRYMPEIFLIASTSIGCSLAPRMASRLGTGLTADCVSLDIDIESRRLIQTRPAFGGNLMASIICPYHRPQMCTIKPRVMKAVSPDYLRRAEVIAPRVVIPGAVNASVIDIIKDAGQRVNLSEADIIVSAGRGMEEPRNLEMIYELAGVLGASVGGSRAIVDAGWLDYRCQIGQTGKTVRPKVYFACGISGAIQHLAGITASKLIVAINSDPDAPIFKVSHLGIVGDVKKIIPAFINEFNKGGGL